MNDKQKALAKYLDNQELDTSEELEPTDYDDSLFNVGREEYLVLTDSEADKRTRENILDSLWAFKTEFIAAHISSDLDSSAVKALGEMQAKLCEGANPIVRAMIADLDHFVDDAIAADGRGHFLSSFDGEESEVMIDGKALYIYRMN